MAKKKVKAVVKMLIKAGAANPAPPVGSILGPYGIQLMEFCKGFNDQTKAMQGMVPALITVYEDRTFDFVIKTPPVAELLKQALSIPKGAANPKKDTAATITYDQLKEIAEKKMPDLNAHDLDSAILMVKGTCKSMGVKFKES